MDVEFRIMEIGPMYFLFNNKIYMSHIYTNFNNNYVKIYYGKFYEYQKIPSKIFGSMEQLIESILNDFNDRRAING